MDKSQLHDFLSNQYGLNPIGELIRLEGGEKNKVYKISNLDLVVRIYQPTAPLDGIIFEHRLMSLLSKQMACVAEPLLTKQQKTFFVFDGQPVAVLPYLRGTKPTRADCEDSFFCGQAGSVLGQMHKISTACLNELPVLHSRIPIAFMNPFFNHLFDWEKASKWLSATKFSSELPYIKAQLGELWSFITEKKDMPLIPIHGDYYKGNILWDKEKITGVIDFDDAKKEWAAFEIARALWEFARNDKGLILDEKCQEAYLAGYSSANPGIKHDLTLYWKIIKLIRLLEILSTATSMLNGDLLYTQLDEEGFQYQWLNLLWCKKLPS